MWKITLPDGTTVTNGETTVRQYVAVSDLMQGADWTKVEPYVGPRQLACWIAVLMSDGTDADIITQLELVMTMPMPQLVGMLEVAS